MSWDAGLILVEKPIVPVPEDPTPEEPEEPSEPKSPITPTGLPQTATSWFNLLVIGFALLILGAGLFVTTRKRKVQ